MAKKTTGKAKPAAAKGGGKKTTTGKGRVSNTHGGGKGDGCTTTNGHSSGDNAAIQASFLQHRSRWTQAMGKMKVAEKGLKDMVAEAKADGFLKKEFEIADALQASPKREAKIVGEVTTRLRVARWIGHAMGKQYDLFENPPISVETSDEAAFDDGKRAAMEGKTMTPPDHFSAGALAQNWIAGYHVGQADVVKSGIKPLETEEPAWADGAPDTAPAAGWGNSRPATVN